MARNRRPTSLWAAAIALVVVFLITVGCADDAAEVTTSQGTSTTTTTTAVTSTAAATTTTTRPPATTTTGVPALEEQAVIETIARDLSADNGVWPNPVTPDAGRCMAEGMVSQFGLARAQALGSFSDFEATLASMTHGEQDTLADLFTECVDLRLVLTLTIPFPPEDQLDCLLDALDDDLVQYMILASVREQDPIQEARLTTIFDTCMPPEPSTTTTAAVTTTTAAVTTTTWHPATPGRSYPCTECADGTIPRWEVGDCLLLPAGNSIQEPYGDEYVVPCNASHNAEVYLADTLPHDEPYPAADGEAMRHDYVVPTCTAARPVIAEPWRATVAYWYTTPAEWEAGLGYVTCAVELVTGRWTRQMLP